METRQLPGLSRYRICENGAIQKAANNRYMTWEITSLGYARVGLTFDDGTKKHMYVHRLVAQAFLDNPQNLNEVNHKDENKLNRSEYGYGILFWLEEHEQQLVDEFQNKHKDYLVYHVIKTETRDFGTVYDLLYVSPNEDDWILDRKELKNNLVMSYSVTEFAEFGLIKIRCINGGLTRIY